MTAVGFPWAIGDDGRTTLVDRARHVRDLIELILFTSPGERVNRPTFGSGLLQAVFGPSSDEVSATAQVLVSSALQQWMGDLIEVEAVAVEHVDSTLTVTVQYVIRAERERHLENFVREV
jgi:phage baseplate assembly protein W